MGRLGEVSFFGHNKAAAEKKRPVWDGVQTDHGPKEAIGVQASSGHYFFVPRMPQSTAMLRPGD